MLLGWLAGLVAPAAACAGDVAVLLSADVPEYQQALDGFRQATQHDVVGVYNMKGDLDQGRRLLRQIERDVKPDLILAVGYWALQVAAQDEPGVPVVFTMVPNPASVVAPGAADITGASMNVPVPYTFEAIKELYPAAQRVGVIYSGGTTGPLVEQARTAAARLGIELVAHDVDSPRAALRALEALREADVQALWIVPDKTVLEDAVFRELLRFSFRHKVPLIGLSEKHAELGAVLSLTFDSSQDIGAQAGDLANQVLAGQPARQVPATWARKVRLYVNPRSAGKLGIQVPQSLLDRANVVGQ